MVDPDVLRETRQAAGPELAAIRREEVRVADNAKTIEALDGVFATRTRSPRTTSGIVEMRPPKSSSINGMGLRIAALVLFACSANGATPSDKSWKNLGRSIKKAEYTAITRDGRCLIGRIESRNIKSLTIDSVRLDRGQLLRVGDTASDHDVLYSGRSSWSDLSQTESNQYESIYLELKDKTSLKCRKLEGSAGGATCDGRTVSKSEVARGYYLRLAPASEWEHRALRESVPLLAPRLWFNLALYPRIKVLLYDASVPEENETIECNRPTSSSFCANTRSPCAVPTR